MSGESQRENWGDRVGFFFAASGSAIGLGNVWRFPTITGENGGAAFVLIYLVAVLTVGMPVMLAELALGRQTRKSPVRAFEKLAPKTPWKSVGLIAVVASLAIVSYYSVVASWTVVYTVQTARGTFSRIPNSEYISEQFASLTGNAWSAIGALAVFVAVTTLVVLGGIQNGIERWSKILMPLLLFILVLLMVRSVTLPGAATGLAFYLNPDFSKVSFKSVLDAISQAFFSLSLGMGIMITYGSYLKKDSDVVSSTFWICLADSSIAVLAGFVIFPALFTIPGLQPTQGANLIFLVLPSIFDKLPGGTLFGTGFFALLALAALTSSISLLEVVVSFCMDTLNWTRKKSVFAAGMAVFLLGLPSALAANAVPSLSKLPLLGMSFLDLMDAVFGKLCLTITALAICIFVGWRWGVDAALEGLAQPAWVLRFWSFLLRVACPILILTILIGLLV